MRRQRKQVTFNDRGGAITVKHPYFQTIDLDFCNKSKLERIVYKIINMPCCIEMEVRPTWRGYHLIIYCTRRCDVCRLLYDDFMRYAYDLYRPPHLRNILWTAKYYGMGER